MTRSERELDEAWQADAAALARESRRGLPYLKDTAAALAAARSNARNEEEPKMIEKLRRRPILTALAAIALLLVLVPTSYAVVTRVILDIDPDWPDEPEEEIERALRDQLEAAGVRNAEVFVDKEESSGERRMEIGIETDDPNAGPLDIRVRERGDDEVDGERRRIAVRLEADPEDPRSEELVALARSPEVKDLLRSGDEYEDIAAYADAIEAYFYDRGFPDVTATVIGEGSLEVIIR